MTDWDYEFGAQVRQVQEDLAAEGIGMLLICLQCEDQVESVESEDGEVERELVCGCGTRRWVR